MGARKTDEFSVMAAVNREVVRLDSFAGRVRVLEHLLAIHKTANEKDQGEADALLKSLTGELEADPRQTRIQGT